MVTNCNDYRNCTCVVIFLGLISYIKIIQGKIVGDKIHNNENGERCRGV